MKSKLLLEEKVKNKDRKFAANPEYFPCHIVMPDGTEIDGLFTKSQITVAIQRANKNKEDIPKESFFEKIFK